MRAVAPAPIDVFFMVTPGILLLDLAGIADALRIANQFARAECFRCRFVGPAPAATTSIGLPLGALEPLPRKLPASAWVVVCGMAGSEGRLAAGELAAVTEWLKRVVRAQHLVVCVCAGALVAAAAGLLDGRQCTSHHDHTGWLRRHHPKAHVLENRIFVEDGNVYTSAGVTSGIDLALVLIAAHAGHAVAAAVARDLVVYLRRAGTDPQISPWMAARNHLHPVVHRIQDEIMRAPQHPWTLPELAHRASVSTRTLSRLFRTETGTTPLAYLASIRLALAREELRTTRLSVEQIAERAGFSSALQLRRLVRQHGLGSPRALRRSAALAE